MLKRKHHPAGSFLITFMALAALAAGLVCGMPQATSASSEHVSFQIIANEQETPPAPTPDEEDESILNPFPVPVTEEMTQTVMAVLADYEQMSVARQQEEEAVADVIEPLYIPNSFTLVYIPFVSTVTASPATEPTPTPEPPPPPPADIAVAIWPNPSIYVARNGLLVYEIRVKNYGKGSASYVHVKLPYTTQQMNVTDSSFERTSDWVSELTADHVTVTFGGVAAQAYCEAKIFFKVGQYLEHNTVISTRASYTWSDRRDGGEWRSNWAPVLVGSGDASAPWVWLKVGPVYGVAGTTYHFFTDRYIPGEGIYIWLNTPTGVEPLELRGQADLMGRVWLDFQSTGLKPGTYCMVLYGARSNLTAIANFSVTY
jgi:hypothetical protein